MIDLITASIVEQNDAYLIQFPQELLDDTEKDLVDFTFKFYARYGTLPDLADLSKKFSWFVPFVWSTTRPPLLKIYDEAIERKLMIYTRRLMSEISSEMTDSGTVNLPKFAEIQRIHCLSEGMDTYTTFDRETYFRRSRFNFPFSVLNSAMGGMADGDYMLVIGRLGTGKSMLTQYAAKSFFEQGLRVLYTSGEMPSADVFSRIDGMVANFNPRQFREGRSVQAEADVELVKTTIKNMDGKGEIYVPRSRIVSPTQVMSLAINLKVDLVFIDGVYLMRPSSGWMRDRYQNLAAISNELKQLALDSGIPIIGTAQIKRGADRTGRGTYTTEAVSGSDSFGQDVDFLVAIDPDPVMPELVQLQLIKNRYGPEVTSFVEIDYETMEVEDGMKNARHISITGGAQSGTENQRPGSDGGNAIGGANDAVSHPPEEIIYATVENNQGGTP